MYIVKYSARFHMAKDARFFGFLVTIVTTILFIVVTYWLFVSAA